MVSTMYMYILFVALPAFSELDNVAGDHSKGVLVDPGGCTYGCCPSLHMVAGEAAFVAAGAASTC